MFSFADFLLLPPFAVTTADAVEPPTGLPYNQGVFEFQPGVHKKGTVYLFHKDKNEKFVHQNHENWPFWSTIMYILPH